ncbi:hypothetical protein DIPPA_11029 [Diplonema papillatum]|nr:hypothetical protein DIPPA_11029 [Diplonema papillatum]
MESDAGPRMAPCALCGLLFTTGSLPFHERSCRKASISTSADVTAPGEASSQKVSTPEAAKRTERHAFGEIPTNAPTCRNTRRLNPAVKSSRPVKSNTSSHRTTEASPASTDDHGLRLSTSPSRSIATAGGFHQGQTQSQAHSGTSTKTAVPIPDESSGRHATPSPNTVLDGPFTPPTSASRRGFAFNDDGASPLAPLFDHTVRENDFDAILFPPNYDYDDTLANSPPPSAGFLGSLSTARNESGTKAGVASSIDNDARKRSISRDGPPAGLDFARHHSMSMGSRERLASVSSSIHGRESVPACSVVSYTHREAPVAHQKGSNSRISPSASPSPLAKGKDPFAFHEAACSPDHKMPSPSQTAQLARTRYQPPHHQAGLGSRSRSVPSAPQAGECWSPPRDGQQPASHPPSTPPLRHTVPQHHKQHPASFRSQSSSASARTEQGAAALSTPRLAASPAESAASKHVPLKSPVLPPQYSESTHDQRPETTDQQAPGRTPTRLSPKQTGKVKLSHWTLDDVQPAQHQVHACSPSARIRVPEFKEGRLGSESEKSGTRSLSRLTKRPSPKGSFADDLQLQANTTPSSWRIDANPQVRYTGTPQDLLAAFSDTKPSQPASTMRREASVHAQSQEKDDPGEGETAPSVCSRAKFDPLALTSGALPRQYCRSHERSDAQVMDHHRLGTSSASPSPPACLTFQSDATTSKPVTGARYTPADTANEYTKSKSPEHLQASTYDEQSPLRRCVLVDGELAPILPLSDLTTKVQLSQPRQKRQPTAGSSPTPSRNLSFVSPIPSPAMAPAPEPFPRAASESTQPPSPRCARAPIAPTHPLRSSSPLPAETERNGAARNSSERRSPSIERVAVPTHVTRTPPCPPDAADDTKTGPAPRTPAARYQSPTAASRCKSRSRSPSPMPSIPPIGPSRVSSGPALRGPGSAHAHSHSPSPSPESEASSLQTVTLQSHRVEVARLRALLVQTRKSCDERLLKEREAYCEELAKVKEEANRTVQSEKARERHLTRQNKLECTTQLVLKEKLEEANATIARQQKELDTHRQVAKSLEIEHKSLRASKRSYSTELNHCKEELSKFQVRTEPKKRQTHHKDLQSLQNELVKIKAELLREKTKTEKLQAVLRSRQQVTSSDAQSLNLEKRQRDLEVKERVYKGNENRLLDDRQELEKAQRQLDKQMKEYHEQHSELLKQRQLLSKDAAQLASLQRQVAAAEEELRAREQQVAEAEKQMERDCTRQTGELKRMQRERERLEAQQGMQKERERAVIERERVADKMSFGLLYAQDTDGAKADCVFGPAYQARSESKGVPAAERTGHEEFHSLPGGFKGCKGNGHMAPTPMPSAPNSISSSPTVAAVVPVGLMSPGLCHGQSNRRSKTACHTNNRVPVSDPEACPAPLSTPPRDSLTGGNSHVYNIPSPSKPAQHHKTRRRVSASSGTSNTRHSQPKLYNSLSAPRNSGATLFSSASHNSVIAVNSLNQSVHSATHTAAHAKFPGTLEELELRKQNAIKNEDFALAKRIKDQIQSLTDFQASLTQLRCKQEPDGAPGMLDELQYRKELAVRSEDFVAAQAIKEQIEAAIPRDRFDYDDRSSARFENNCRAGKLNSSFEASCAAPYNPITGGRRASLNNDCYEKDHAMPVLREHSPTRQPPVFRTGVSTTGSVGTHSKVAVSSPRPLDFPRNYPSVPKQSVSYPASVRKSPPPPDPLSQLASPPQPTDNNMVTRILSKDIFLRKQRDEPSLAPALDVQPQLRGVPIASVSLAANRRM